MSHKQVVGLFAGSGSTDYHLRELDIALDSHRPEHAMPPYLPPPARILDIGCGAGQTLIAGFPDRVSFGIDVDSEALKLGPTLTDRVCFARGVAEALPYRSDAFEMVVARVSLPYTRLSESLAEIRRVLKPGGLLWAVLHPFRMAWTQAWKPGFKAKISFAYVFTNGLLFHCFQKQLSLLGRSETFQTRHGIRKALERSGFCDTAFDLTPHQFVVTAHKS